MKRGLLSLILSCLLLTLVLVNILLAFGNQSLQGEVGERQQTIAQAIQLEELHRQVIGVLAEMAIKTNDARLKELLTASGISLKSESGKPSE